MAKSMISDKRHKMSAELSVFVQAYSHDIWLTLYRIEYLFDIWANEFNGVKGLHTLLIQEELLTIYSDFWEEGVDILNDRMCKLINFPILDIYLEMYEGILTSYEEMRERLKDEVDTW